MRDRYDEFLGRGAKVAVIGFGRVEDAADFARRWRLPFPVLTDSTRATYRAMGFDEASLAKVVGPANWTGFARALVHGRGVAVGSQSVTQLGGTAVIAPGGGIVYLHTSTRPSDNAPIDELLKVLDGVNRR